MKLTRRGWMASALAMSAARGAESGIRYAPSGFIGRQADALATDRLRGIWKSTGGTFAKNSE